MLSLAERLDPKQTALIVIDVQNDFCHREGGLALSYGAHIVEDIEEAMPNVRNLIAAARSAAVPIVFVRSIYDDEYLSPVMKD